MRNIRNLSVHERTEALIKDNLPTVDEKLVTYTAGGDGGIGALDLFLVTGVIEVVSFIGSIEVTCVETAGTVTIVVGTADDTNLLIESTEPEDLIAGDIWVTGPADAVKAVQLPVLAKDIIVAEDIIHTIATSTISAGAVRYYLRWLPISSDAAVVPA